MFTGTLREVKDYIGPLLFLVESYKPEYFFWETIGKFRSWKLSDSRQTSLSHVSLPPK